MPSSDPTTPLSPPAAHPLTDLPAEFAELRVSTTSSPDLPPDGTASRSSPGETSEAAPQEPRLTHFLCISPDAPTNPVLYWLGPFDSTNTRFLLEQAKGPLRLDLGDVLYAPNTLQDAQVRLGGYWGGDLLKGGRGLT
jgi:hypothetical protein